MVVSGKLVWIRLQTTRKRVDGRYGVVHHVELLPQLDTQGCTSPEEGDISQSERWSPMYLVGDPSSLPCLEPTVTGIFWLLSDTKPVELAALLESHVLPNLPYGLFLTHGMASVILLLESAHPALDPEALFSERPPLLAIEQWTVEGGRLCDCAVFRDGGEPDVLTSEPKAASSCPEHMPHAVFRQIQDNDLVVKRVLELSAKYRPRCSQGVRDLLKRSSQMLDRIGTVSEQAGSGDAEARQILQRSAYSLVHLNSMLAYFVSQGLSGKPSVLEDRGLMPSHSLFGVATAYAAVWQVTHFIEEGFLRFDILSEMQARYFTDRSADYHSDLFKPALDDMQARPSEAERKAPGHVNLFSGRLGFHSSPWAVAAPVETLNDGAAPAWNLLTLSHELLHVHVDAILRFVLSPNPTKEGGLGQDQLYMRMAGLAMENAASTDLSIIDRIRQKVARYIMQSAACRWQNTAPLSQLPHAKTVDLAEVTAPSQFGDMLVAFWRRLTEYIVHILDFHYFYWGDVEHYLSLVLTSWATIPSVYDDIGHYIMRCLLTVSTREMDPDTGTSLVEPLDFEASLQLFADCIEGLADFKGCSHLASMIKGFVADPDNKEFLRLEFIRAKALVWMTVMYLYCRPLRMYFEVGTDVPGGILSDTALCPEFEFGRVQERLPVSPIALLDKYLRLDYDRPEGWEDLAPEAASVWLFSWIASCGPVEGGPDASGE